MRKQFHLQQYQKEQKIYKLTKEVKDLCNENYKILTKKIKDTNIQKNRLCAQIPKT